MGESRSPPISNPILPVPCSSLSVYGFCGATKGFLCCVPIAASVTATGRTMIAKTKALVETMVPGSRVVYGDSVAGYTPCVVCADREVAVTTFDRLADAYGVGGWARVPGTDKEACEVRAGVEVWSERGWTALERVIRHRAGKPMVRVVTRTGVVDVTADHSLLRPDGTPVRPEDVAAGEELLHADLPGVEAPRLCPPSVEEARIQGFFFATGRADASTWQLTHHLLPRLDAYLRLCEEVYPQHAWKIVSVQDEFGADTLLLVPAAAEGVAAMAAMYARRLVCGTSKVIPADVLAAPLEVRQAFWRGMYEGGGMRGTAFHLSIDFSPVRMRVEVTSQLSAMHVFLLIGSVGFPVAVDACASRPGVFAVVATGGNTRLEGGCVVQQTFPVDYPPDAHVYDVTTRNHHFSAGVGRLVVHNTDSVMCILNLGEDKRHDMAAHFSAAAQLAAKISDTFPKPVELEFEKTYYPYLLFSKKRYAGLMFTSPDKPDYVDVKGLQLVRRDNCPLVKEVSAAILDKIMHERSPEGAVEEARACVLRVLRGEEPLEQFVVSKALRTDYKNTAQPHLHVARKILQRTGSSVPSGVRVPFVYVFDAKSHGVQAECAEDPEYVRENGLQLDLLHYVDHQLRSPISALLELLVDDPDAAVFGHPPVSTELEALTTVQQEAKRVRRNQEARQPEITSFFKRKAN